MTVRVNIVLSSQHVLLNPMVNSKGFFEKGEGRTKDDWVPLLNNEMNKLKTMVAKAIAYCPLDKRKIENGVAKIKFSRSLV